MSDNPQLAPERYPVSSLHLATYRIVAGIATIILCANLLRSYIGFDDLSQHLYPLLLTVGIAVAGLVLIAGWERRALALIIIVSALGVRSLRLADLAAILPAMLPLVLAPRGDAFALGKTKNGWRVPYRSFAIGLMLYAFIALALVFLHLLPIRRAMPILLALPLVPLAALLLPKRIHPFLWFCTVVLYAAMTYQMLDFLLPFSLVVPFLFHPRWLKPRYATGDGKQLLFFDGECGLCSRLVRLLLIEDLHHVLHYAPLEGETAKELLRKYPQLEQYHGETLVYVRNWGAHQEEVYVKSEGALRVAGDIGGIDRLAVVFLLAPTAIRDRIYDFIARHRHRIAKSCEIPSSDESAQFLP